MVVTNTVSPCEHWHRSNVVLRHEGETTSPLEITYHLLYLREWFWGFYSLLRKNPFPWFIMLGHSNLHYFPHKPVQMPEYYDQGAGVVEHELTIMVTQIFSHNQFLWLVQSDMAEFINSVLDGVTSLSKTYFATFSLGCQICLVILGPWHIYLVTFVACHLWWATADLRKFWEGVNHLAVMFR